MRILVAACLVTVATLAGGAGAFAQTKDVDIPYQKMVLDNGLTLIVHEDHKAPIVAINTWYHVGSKNEKLGKTGFAHLFEHLMFGGSYDLLVSSRRRHTRSLCDWSSDVCSSD